MSQRRAGINTRVAIGLPRDLRDPYFKGKPLSRTEQQILRLIARGLSSAEIGGVRGTGLQTIKKQKKVIFSKLGARTSAQAVAIAMSLDLI